MYLNPTYVSLRQSTIQINEDIIDAEDIEKIQTNSKNVRDWCDEMEITNST